MIDRIVNVEHTLALAQKNERVCPRAIHWVRLYRLLSGRPARHGREPPPPLLESGTNAPALLKMLRLKEQIRWAAAHGALGEVHRFLEQLREEDWLHGGNP
ncbi:MAG: hypothetical protein IT480_10330 [Gammaproteobacteria bacterium]|nr:hypothetical protein [Gammaproteobacteria bacterium]